MIEVVATEEWKDRCYEWIKPKAHLYSDNEKFSYIGIIEDDKILGVILFSDYDGNNIFVHVALDTPRACQRKVIKLMFDYIFNQAGCGRATATCNNSNERIKKLIEGVGFEQEGLMKNAMQIDDTYVDAAVYGMLKENCKWV
jgi:RimJ/RimL family protein N-acetyltransferase